MSYQHEPSGGINHRDEFDNTSLNHDPNNKEKKLTQRDDMADYQEPRKSSNGLAGFVKNPYVFFTAIFASIGGVLFGCKYLLILVLDHMIDFFHYNR